MAYHTLSSMLTVVHLVASQFLANIVVVGVVSLVSYLDARP